MKGPWDHQDLSDLLDLQDKMVVKGVEVNLVKLEHQECQVEQALREKRDPQEEMDPKDFLDYLVDQVRFFHIMKIGMVY